MHKQLAIESAIVGVLIVSMAYTMLVAPGMPSDRPWLLPLGVVAVLAGAAGIALRRRGNAKVAGLLYCVAALAPNGLYLINAILLAAGIAAVAGVSVDNRKPNRPTQIL